MGAAAEGKGFMAKSITFRNTSGLEGEQAVALRIQSEEMDLNGAPKPQRKMKFMPKAPIRKERKLVLPKAVDFIFGEGTTVIQNSLILVRKPLQSQNILVIVADGSEKSYMIGGLVLHNCTVKMDNDLETDVDKERYEIYLGRPWMPAAKMTVIRSDLGGFLNPE
ncbi:pectinesterase, active site-containing protein [Tanacetum coccineum]